MPKTSILSNKEFLQEKINISKGYADFFRKTHLTNTSGNVGTLKKYLRLYEISVAHFEKNYICAMNMSIEKKKTNEEVFSENSFFSRATLKKRIIKQKLIPYVCFNTECGNEGFWMGKLLSLQLEHKNGINTDNRIENLCFLCPNCHTQTSTYAGKAKKRPFGYKMIDTIKI